jgi:hypothetical protein
MRFTGLRTDAAEATLDDERSSPRSGAGRSVSSRSTSPRAGDRAGDRMEDAVEATSRWLLDRQHADGHWRAPLEGDTILESEYLLLLAWAGRLDDHRVRGAADRILAQQLPGGGWAIYPGGPVDISASVKAYFALKLVGHAATEPALERARLAIAEAGGPWAVEFTGTLAETDVPLMTHSPAAPLSQRHWRWARAGGGAERHRAARAAGSAVGDSQRRAPHEST